jgi:hypothetical protein
MEATRSSTVTYKSSAVPATRPTLTDDEAVTLRRIAFGQSEIRALRREDIDRLRRLGLVVESRNELSLTASGRELFESLPRSIFASAVRQGNGW